MMNLKEYVLQEIDNLYRNIDALKELIELCPSEDGKAIYRRGILRRKVTALIIQGRMIDHPIL